MILKIKIFFQAIGNFFKWTFIYWEDAVTFQDFYDDIIEAYQDAVSFYQLNTDPEFLAIERELAELDTKINETEEELRKFKDPE